MFTTNTGMFEMTDHPGAAGKSARRRGRRISHRDGHARLRADERGGRLPRRDRGLLGRSARILPHAASARQADRPASTRARARRGDRAGPRGDRPDDRARGRGETSQRSSNRPTPNSPPRPISQWPRPSYSPRTPPGTRPIARSKSSAAAAGRTSTASAGTLQDVRVCRIYEGTDEILKLKIAAALLGKEFAAFS